jgi:hypothetical protein
MRTSLFPTALMLAALLGCGSPQSARTEDVARTMVPVPVCLDRLPRAGAGAIVSLSDAEYWSLLLPSYNREARTLPSQSRDCSGRRVPELQRRVAGVRPGALGQVVVSPAADAMKVVWLPVAGSEGGARGVLALTRQVDGYFEVYALGTHEGALAETRFGVERMGPDLLVLATEEHCAGEGVKARCRSEATLYGLRTGSLREMGRFVLSQHSKGSGRDAGLEIRFSASVDFRENSVVLSEHLSSVEPGRGEVRASDLERTFVRDKEGRLVASTPSLWGANGMPAAEVPR